MPSLHTRVCGQFCCSTLDVIGSAAWLRVATWSFIWMCAVSVLVSLVAWVVVASYCWAYSPVWFALIDVSGSPQISWAKLLRYVSFFLTMRKAISPSPWHTFRPCARSRVELLICLLFPIPQHHNNPVNHVLLPATGCWGHMGTGFQLGPFHSHIEPTQLPYVGLLGKVRPW